jgi:hypothetical protein
VIELTRTEIWRCSIPEGSSTADMIRHPWIATFLKEHWWDFDHVFMVDAFDCYFHRDPFEDLNFEGMVFFEEGWPVIETRVNAQWINVCFADEMVYRLNYCDVVCCGTIYGTVDAFLQFEELLLEQRWWKRCTIDQAILNVLLHTGELDARGVRYTMMPCAGPVLTLSNCPRSIGSVSGELEVFNGDGVVPHVVHQWKSFPDFRDLYVKRCDMTKYMIDLQKMLGIDLNWSAPEREPRRSDAGGD